MYVPHTGASMTDPARLHEKTCIVTGGSRGLGRAICVAFARAGATVAFTYAHDDGYAEEARAAIAEAGRGSEVLAFKGSVADGAHVKEVVADLANRWGRVDVLVNNAGINQIYPLALIDEADWDYVMDVNVKGAYLFSKAVLRHMIRAKRGHILNIGSFASERFVESPIHYATAKSALRGMTEALALEVGKHNVIVNLLSPGLLDVGMSTKIPRRRVSEYTAQSAMGRLGTADEIARVAAFMVSDDNTFMTGAKLVLDGGL